MNFKTFLEKYDMKALMKKKVPLDSEERKEVMSKGAVWRHGPNGEETPAVWKSKDSKGNFVYGCNTHRAGTVKPTLKGAIKAFDFIKTTS